MIIETGDSEWPFKVCNRRSTNAENMFSTFMSLHGRYSLTWEGLELFIRFKDEGAALTWVVNHGDLLGA